MIIVLYLDYKLRLMKILYALLFVLSIVSSDLVSNLLVWKAIDTFILDLSPENGNDSEPTDTSESENKVDFFQDFHVNLLENEKKSNSTLALNSSFYSISFQELFSPPPDLYLRLVYQQQRSFNYIYE